MKGSFKLFDIFGISINIHVTFILLLLFLAAGGVKWLVLLVAIFTFVTIHELCHSLVARRFGISVREITLLPIGGVASMTKMPDRPRDEFLIAIAGPLSNIAILLILYFPFKLLIGEDALLAFLRTGHLSAATWPSTFAYIYWINLFLAGFNMLPAFPMDGGRIFRSLLALVIGYQKATKIAAGLGHLFALVFAYFGIMKPDVVLLAIAVFIYMSASGEEAQANVKETLKRFKVRDILAGDFLTVSGDATLTKVLEMIFHSHQEDFPVVDGDRLVGFVTRQDIIINIHRSGMNTTVADMMRKSFPTVTDTDSLIKVQGLMQENSLRALPVTRSGRVVGVVTVEDIGRVYAMMAQKT